ncbi:mycofactocin system GMC family oxidoreductase MftG [Mycobacterium sp. MYCO198283]|uniref:mycofactocin dehydrogenase MftG n=1 Tax=Mycobacterium sp. MYCO198283 TaxID=2883505 RepID=UPI001E4A445C|nr:mycofactocin system GMC family oxidoreductase MftG [Mycobacterium sp. MYCO198283]MCG5431876.1 mycofactocin system GMC family oxidoreductase MftG [Mycobacterium sp. MYCO198283]
MHSDVLVIGAGSAGSVVAERLSADLSCAVTVLEAGPAPTDPGVGALIADATVLPVGAASRLVQRYETTLTEHPPRRSAIVRGAVAGGSGAVNGGYFCHGLPADFDGWRLPGWSWAEVVPAFAAIETDLDFPQPPHGTTGPITVRRTSGFEGGTADFVSAATAAGYPWLADLNAGGPDLPTGIGAVPLNVVDGRRMGPGAAFLTPALSRPNLRLASESRVRRLRFRGGRAVGVEVDGPAGGQYRTADRFVLTAGAIATAQLLLLSGVGDPAALAAVGVECHTALAVGQRTSDHPEWVMPTQWRTRTGRPVLEVVLSTADVEIRPYTGGFVAMVGDGGTGRPDWPHLGVAVMHPASRGRVALRSADPDAPPRIEHRYDSAPSDVTALREGCALAAELGRRMTVVGEPSWSTSQHLCGTAPMGVDGDPHAVVDPRGRLRGIENVWVADGSVLPAITGRGVHATIVMAAHRIAGFVAG